MRRLLAKTTVCTAFLVMLASAAHGQVPSGWPAPVDLSEYNAPDRIGHWGYPAFRPIGWSEDGRFAYIRSRTMDGRGGTVFDYVILDAVTDEIAWYRSDDSFDWEAFQNDPDYDYDREPEIAWERNGDAFLGALEDFNIQVGAGVDLRRFKFQHRGVAYDATVTTTAADPPEMFDELESYEVRVIRSDGTSKRITGSDEVLGYRMWIAGYFKSPFEDRILVVIGREQYVFEGTEAFFHFSGCHLNVGFDQ